MKKELIKKLKKGIKEVGKKALPIITATSIAAPSLEAITREEALKIMKFGEIRAEEVQKKNFIGFGYEWNRGVKGCFIGRNGSMIAAEVIPADKTTISGLYALKNGFVGADFEKINKRNLKESKFKIGAGGKTPEIKIGENGKLSFNGEIALEPSAYDATQYDKGTTRSVEDTSFITPYDTINIRTDITVNRNITTKTSVTGLDVGTKGGLTYKVKGHEIGTEFEYHSLKQRSTIEIEGEVNTKIKQTINGADTTWTEKDSLKEATAKEVNKSIITPAVFYRYTGERFYGSVRAFKHFVNGKGNGQGIEAKIAGLAGKTIMGLGAKVETNSKEAARIEAGIYKVKNVSAFKVYSKAEKNKEQREYSITYRGNIKKVLDENDKELFLNNVRIGFTANAEIKKVGDYEAEVEAGPVFSIPKGYAQILACLLYTSPSPRD